MTAATLPGYFLAPDADGTPTVWRGAPADTQPIAVITVRDLRGDDPIWAAIAAVVEDVTCPACAGVGAIRHGSRNPELVQDCIRCAGDGVVAA